MTFQGGRELQGFLHGVRVLEIADERGEYCGKVLAGLGADVLKVEPPGGERTRAYGPFDSEATPPNNSLYFRHYNFGKRSIVLDLSDPIDRGRFLQCAETADVLIDARLEGLQSAGFMHQHLLDSMPRIIVAHMSDFGSSGPWSHFRGSDLVHLALGGVVMNCGYDPEPSGDYDLPPVAPQMWQSYQIAGEMMLIAILSALMYRIKSGSGQILETPIHQAVAQQTETDVPNWIFARLKHFRMTGRHSRPSQDPAALALTKDGRWLLPYRSYLGGNNPEFNSIVEVLDSYGMAEDLTEAKYQSKEYRSDRVVLQHIYDVVARFVAAYKFDRDVWRPFQDAGSTWAPVRKPEENVDDEHWQMRETFFGGGTAPATRNRPASEVGARWYCAEVPWRIGPHAPELPVLRAEKTIWLDDPAVDVAHGSIAPGGNHSTSTRVSRRGKPFALDDVRILDLSWLLASAGAGRFLGAMGAEVIKVEHRTRLDPMRWRNGISPEGGREERDRMSGTVTRDQELPAAPDSPNRSGFFMDINAGKRAISLNLKSPQGKNLLTELIGISNALIEGFSPGTMDRLGFGYDRLQKINPSIVYVQQSGMGQHGSYGRMRSYGPVAQAFSGLTDMSGFPEPYPPAGIGYSYLDWFGAYNMATALYSGLYRQRTIGRGCWIDASQVEIGTFLTGTAVLDWSVNGRSWKRYGNASPYKAAAPHGIYRTEGEDRWIAIACFTEQHWRALVDVIGAPSWCNEPSFQSLEKRLQETERLDERLLDETAKWESRSLMMELQNVGVPAGVCQTAEERCEQDQQLRHLGWMTELEQSEIGRWPAKEIPVSMSKTPPYIGGSVDRHGPNYAEDNEYVFGEILGYSSSQINRWREADVL